MTVLLVALGAAVGAPTRYLTDRAVQLRFGPGRPWGTLSVNVVASLVLGILVGAQVATTAAALVGTGFCGALSTYSTFAYETMRLDATGRRGVAVANVGLSLVAGIGAAALGYVIGGG